ncbi:MAG: J domain-containing protein [Bacteroidetes bacterium]|nr:J domain-containing protein [Bacteroidota bacterium]
MAALKDYYRVLGVKEDAGKAEIKKVFRKLAREFHPDRNQDKPGAEERFKEVQEAYEVLSNDANRRKYDHVRKNPFGEGFEGMFTSGRGEQFYQTPDGTFVRVDDPGGRGGYRSEGPLGGRGDIFSQFFGSGEPAQREKGRRSTTDSKRTVRLSFKRMLTGGKVRIEVGGKKIQVPFPKGVHDGYRVRVPGKGRVGPDGRPGDLYITFRVTEHHDFERTGNDIHTRVSISAMDAILGVYRSVNSPYGKKIKLRLPAGVQPGEVLRVRGQGIETEKGKGNLLVHVQVEIPTNLTKEQRETLELAAKAAGIR